MITQIAPQFINLKVENWESSLKKPIKDRELYKLEGQVLHFGQILGRFLGTPLDEVDYNNMLYDLQQSELKIHILNVELDKTISQEHFQAIQEVFMIHQKEKGFSINRLVAFLKGKGLIPLAENPFMNYQLQKNLIDILKTFEVNHAKGLTDVDFRRMIIDIIKWMWNHIGKWFENFSVENDVFPKVVWYGDASKSQVYFLYFLLKLGCDILIFHPEGKDIFAEIDHKRGKGFIHQYPDKKPAKPFPQERIRRESTIAHRASRELEIVLNNENSGIYKPWQFRDYIPKSLSLKSTYDEIFLMVKEKAMIRPGFKVQNGEVYIPCIFSKVSGVSTDKKEYWSRLQDISHGDFTICIRNFPFTKESRSDYRFHYQQSLGKNGKLSVEKIMNGNWWGYKHLPSGLQRGLASAIVRYCERPKLKKDNNESQAEFLHYMFGQAFTIPESILKLIQKFDYSQEVPRLVLYNNETNGILSREDACLILLLNEFGLDIVIYNPVGHNDLEFFIGEEFFDNHWLEEVAFEQEFPDKESSRLGQVFNSIFNRVSKS